jgi:hypothetical protein
LNKGSAIIEATGPGELEMRIPIVTTTENDDRALEFTASMCARGSPNCLSGKVAWRSTVIGRHH